MNKYTKIFLVVIVSCLAVSQSLAKKAQPLRLLYWNVQNGMWDGQTDNYQRFTNWVSQQNPDICVWCEAQKLYKTGTDSRERETEEECLNRWKELAQRYGHKYIYLSAHPDNYPQLITSKYPVEMIKKIAGNQDTVVCHGASWSALKIAGKTINIVTLHTWPQGYGYKVPNEQREASRAKFEGDKFRRVEMEYICKQTVLQHKNSKNELWMMMGDFNSISKVDNNNYKIAETDERYIPKFLTHEFIRQQTPYMDVVKEKHPNEYIASTGSGNRIDFVYLTPALFKMVKDANIISDSYTKPVRNPQNISNFWHPSDHLPIIVNFEIK